ncbi:ClbS/DfsB family four-helix bundle protein [Flavobacterium salilacus subsp. salilacus]|uniref:ClbS/DfsB family four-helix bundle protein n=1 Tax=Flavobacterium TaxID=237 RepID=UPI0010750BF1|nr:MULTISPECIES: ClbS/DfsB family four-helix bundle protein [Flavobacterium]KAF2518394.1 ClbS/DfsB family four-helix bundle protein [Flavobacterium salilacus subsp. salilacus]MBE1615028.1 ClbS/DfsB family four-helix bundle protein [Flavobacterium sp. SaA2.13]
MPRPKTKEELLYLSNENFKKLYVFIENLGYEEQVKEFPEGTMNRNIRDVLAHLHHWHLLMLNWYEVGMSGAKPEIPAKGYTWKTTPELNKWIWNEYQNKSLDEVKALLADSFKEVQHLIVKHTDEELFEKKRYKWTGTTSLGACLISASSSHYDWAIKLIKKNKKIKPAI